MTQDKDWSLAGKERDPRAEIHIDEPNPRAIENWYSQEDIEIGIILMGIKKVLSKE